MPKNLRLKNNPILLIGGLDPSAGAGLLADAKECEVLGLSYWALATALTFQDEFQFISFQKSKSTDIEKQIHLLNHQKKLWVKIGMLASAKLAETIFSSLSQFSKTFIILDPVFKSSTDKKLIDDHGKAFIIQRALHDVDVITPNVFELNTILNQQKMILDASELAQRAQSFLKTLNKKSRLKHILLKGGHSLEVEKDYLISKNEIFPIVGQLLKNKFCHGTGCSFASALLASMAAGSTLQQAAEYAKKRVEIKIIKKGWN